MAHPHSGQFCFSIGSHQHSRLPNSCSLIKHTVRPASQIIHSVGHPAVWLHVPHPTIVVIRPIVIRPGEQKGSHFDEKPTDPICHPTQELSHHNLSMVVSVRRNSDLQSMHTTCESFLLHVFSFRPSPKQSGQCPFLMFFSCFFVKAGNCFMPVN